MMTLLSTRERGHAQKSKSKKRCSSAANIAEHNDTVTQKRVERGPMHFKYALLWNDDEDSEKPAPIYHRKKEPRPV